jgi:hypothetical protein
MGILQAVLPRRSKKIPTAATAYRMAINIAARERRPLNRARSMIRQEPPPLTIINFYRYSVI